MTLKQYFNNETQYNLPSLEILGTSRLSTLINKTKRTAFLFILFGKHSKSNSKGLKAQSWGKLF